MFSNKESKQINFLPLIGKGISAKLLDLEYFKQVSLEEGGGIQWLNGLDFCPNYLKDYVN
jgi:hypothetical protein